MSIARLKTENLLARLERAGILATFAQAETLRRAARTLQRWYELECGDGNGYASWAIERDDNGDGPPYLVTYPHNGKPHRCRIADRKAGAKRRVDRVAAELGVHVRYQTDPRGAAIYVSREPMPEDGSHRGVCCEVQ
jgi:hypothetical protein